MLLVVSAILAALHASAPVVAAEYEVGPGKPYAEVEEVPWEALEPGDIVSIHARREPYRAKWVICRRGTRDQPIVVRGIRGADRRLPVIDGRDAVTRKELNYWGEKRGIIKIGGANRPEETTPAYIVVENLEIRSGRAPHRFTGRSGEEPYSANAASIFIEKGERITIRGCILHDSGNGLFTSPGTREILVEHCSIYGNGAEGSIYEHNNYTSSQRIIFQFNHFGPPRAGCPGNNLKDRSSGLVVRYNWIEGGSRTLDLVDGDFSEDPDYRHTFVYGNVLVKLDKGNNQVVHYGGDSGQTDRYRKGVLYFFHNTVVSHRSGTTTLFRLSSDQERVECHNNVVYTVAPGRHLALLAGHGNVDLYNNWLKEGWRTSHSGDGGAVRRHGRTLGGEAPGFIDVSESDFRVASDSPCHGAGAPLPQSLRSQHRVRWQYVPHRQRAAWDESLPPDLGALQKVPAAR